MKKIHVNISQTTLEAEKRCRGEIDLLRSRLHLLNGKEKVLMTMYLENGNSCRQIARLTGVSDTSIARRIHILTERLTDGEYITCLRNRDKFTRDQMTIAKGYFLMGLSISKIAAKRHRSRYHVRETIIKIKSILNDCG
ncbi:MAG: hypothetical protein IIB56_08605 [Planctomycetes bacterium]|nr:hypothetical protein [Planctomycetota bacterium]